MTSANGWSSYSYKDCDTGEIIQTIWVNTRKVGLNNADQYIQICSRISRSLPQRLKRQALCWWRRRLTRVENLLTRLKADLFPMWF